MVAGTAYGDPSSMVMMSGKVITTSIPSVTFIVKNPGRDIAKTRVFTMSGEEVAELSAQSLDHFTWDGKDVDNQPVGSGIYVVQIHHGGAVWHSPVMVNR